MLLIGGHVVFFFKSFYRSKRDKENYGECFALGLGKTLIDYIWIKSYLQPLPQQNQQNSCKLFCSN